MTTRARRLDRRTFLEALLGSAVVGCGSSTASAPGVGPIPRAAPVVIIGGGISGLSAGHELLARGFTNVRVVEARDRIGGRIHTDRSTGYAIDLGAAWVQYAGAESNPLLGLLAPLGVTPRRTRWDALRAYDEVTGAIPGAALDAAEARFGGDLRAAGAAVARLANPDVSLGSILAPLLAKGFETPADQRLLRFLIAYYVVNEYAAPLSDIGAYDFSPKAPGPSSPEDDRLVGGFDVLTHWLAKGLTVSLNDPVRRVTYDARGVTVETNSASYEAAAAIVTLPVGVLRTGAVSFEPPLPPAKTEALGRIGYGTFEKAVLVYDAPFWPSSPNAFGYASASPHPSPLWVNVAAISGAPALVAMFTAEGAVHAAGLSDTELRALVTSQVETMFGRAVPAPKAFLRTRWTKDPYSLGAYTYPTPSPVAPAIAALGAPVGGRLFFAGEATDPTWYSYAHGAYLSGIRAAREL